MVFDMSVSTLSVRMFAPPNGLHTEYGHAVQMPGCRASLVKARNITRKKVFS